MSSGSSEVDVKRIRIPAYDDDNTVLYAYEPHTAYVMNKGTVPSDTSYNEEHQRTVQEVLAHCQDIYNAVQNLEKKFDVVHGKVSKIHRLHAKSLGQSHKPFGYAFRNYKYLLYKKNRSQKTRKKDTSLFSNPKSYSPTVPVERPHNDSQVSFLESSYHVDPESPERDPEFIFREQESRMKRSPLPCAFRTDTYQPFYTSAPLPQGPPCIPYCPSPEASNDPDLFAPTEPCSAIHGGVLTQADPVPPHEPAMMPYPASLEDQSFGHTRASPCFPGPVATSSPVGERPHIPANLRDDPSTWSVDDVIEFLNHADPRTLAPIADLFRQHDIDGKALLLLKNDTMLKYMGLKLGTAVKLSHYIDELRGEKHMDF